MAGRAAAPEIGSIYPMENIQTHGPYSASQRDLEFRPFVHSSSSLIFEGPNQHAPLSCQSYDFSSQFPACGRFYPAAETAFQIYSDRSNLHTSHKVVSGTLDHTGATGRGPLKRRRHETYMACERGSTSRHYYGAGSSSNRFEFQPEQPSSSYQNYPFSSMGLPQDRGLSLSIHNDDPCRNVRRRYGPDLEVDPRRTYQSECFYHHYYSRPLYYSNADATAYNQNHFAAFSAAHGSFQTLGSSAVRPWINHNSARGIAGYSHDSNSNRNPLFPPSQLLGLHAQAVRQDCNSYPQTIPSYGTGLSTAHWGQGTAPSENGLQYLLESYSSHCAPFSAGGRHSNHWDIRSRVALESVQPLPNAAHAHHQVGSENQIMVNYSSLYTTRNMFDQYRDMRLDIDNMSYEELLALGERIGNVSTGLSKYGISKCLAKTSYSNLDENKKEGTCAICLEDYNDNYEIGTVKNCLHDYHVECIEKWLSMKNACPICQVPVLAHIV
ncbi:E3 ubiquitin-protein ligase MBR2-like [Pistacia vera]|uniref:E3 ubiquitin-protein ligase MBR2-like n=1 Tax=Pistacia vera TaxID=55513 RepID=UPI001262EF25|nr:E3 ubiquitin-protein ligase MBR2-like [Pistacia vera]